MRTTDLADLLAFQIRAVGTLPAPEREYVFAPPRRWRFDLAWYMLTADGCDRTIRLAVECDGGVWTRGRHLRGQGYENDCEKMAEAMIRGWRVLRVTRNMIDSGAALRYIEELLRK